jgi:glycosyltransferase
MKISIITICYNPGETILCAAESVLTQSYDDLEYIIIDGASSDGAVYNLTRFLTQRGWQCTNPESQTYVFENKKTVIYSAPDQGLYDALNKGVQRATGDVIGFVHADDFLAHQDVLQNVEQCLKKNNAEALYGDLQYVSQKPNKNGDCSVIRQWCSGRYDKKKLTWGWMPPHPTLYLRREIYDQAVLGTGEFFDTSFRCAADYDFMLRILSGLGIEPVYLPQVLVKMRVGGVSNRNLKNLMRKSAEDWRAIRGNRIGHLHTLAWKNLSKLGQFFHKSRGVKLNT